MIGAASLSREWRTQCQLSDDYQENKIFRSSSYHSLTSQTDVGMKPPPGEEKLDGYSTVLKSIPQRGYVNAGLGHFLLTVNKPHLDVLSSHLAARVDVACERQLTVTDI
uniref:Uncharacterized protein n=1 Tax=Timema bartmani TaxID=61472 RepID=A0A7R9F4E5_9NEOP|nr:unnamed protein product [Timema bartmani]